jgi:hypothetical protein
VSGAKWMDFSGGPAIILPERLAGAWNGMFAPLPDDSRAADLELPDGRAFQLLSPDFERPVTDYDRLCETSLGSPFRPVFTYPVGRGVALVINSGGDGVIGWWHDQQMVVAVSEFLPEPSVLVDLEWGHDVLWRVPSSRLFLMNSTLHGADPDKSERDCTVIELEPGEYSVAMAEPPGEVWVELYRFSRLG